MSARDRHRPWFRRTDEEARRSLVGLGVIPSTDWGSPDGRPALYGYIKVPGDIEPTWAAIRARMRAAIVEQRFSLGRNK